MKTENHEKTDRQQRVGTWTEAQKRVIDTRNKNILVSAAAGSGKTAVLVERIISRILDLENPLDVDKILVVTFTNAAASEMRERILKAIEKELEKNPDNLHLQRQQAYIHNAAITTIHSFCLNLIREHFNDVDLDPGVKVADSGEIELLKSDVIKEVLEEYYESGDEVFYRFVSQFEGKNNDDYIEEMVLNLYKKAMGYPWPEEWLRNCVKFYEYADEEAFKESIFLELMNEYADGVLNEILNKYNLMLELCGEGGLEVYTDTFENEQEAIRSILKETDYDRRRSLLNVQFNRLPRCGKDGYDEEIKKIVTDSRSEIKDIIKKLRERMYYQSVKEAIREVEKCHDIIQCYVELTKSFLEKFRQKKHEKNIIDFDDFEHYAIEILITKEDGMIKPTKTADELAQDYKEVMVDEYQDSNLVQETILNSISAERFGIHNRFMVGDVKQSIYGFRGANPDIFLEKYNQYSTDHTAINYKIILDRNFRSRKGIIDTVNFFFYQLMNCRLGGINYDDENRLNYGAAYMESEDKNDNLTESRKGIDDRTELILINTKEEPEKEQAEHTEEYDEILSEEAEDLSATAYEAEAKVIARRIKELTDKKTGMKIYDKDLKEYRNLHYFDIVILLRSTGGIGESVYNELLKEGIPAHMESKSGYFNTLEIRTIISYLRIIDNPIQDLPLAAVLKSPIAGLTDEELAVIRAVGGKDISLYEDVCLYAENTDICKGTKIEYDTGLARRLHNFIEMLDTFRDKVLYMSIYDIINDMLIQTGYYDYVMAMPSGTQRIANIEMLKQKAAAYENGSYKGLFNFIRYIEKMNKYDVDMGEASILSENDDTVKIMTIHKSKGLEFPVVFLANTNKQFNRMDARKKSIVHSKYGIGIDYIDTDTRVRTKNLIKFAIIKRIELDVIEEEMRLFYVACTRAREKLIFTASGVDKKKLERMTEQRKNDSLYLGYGVVSQFHSYLDFIGVPLARNRSFQDIYENKLNISAPVFNSCYEMESNVSVSYLSMQDIFDSLVKEKYLADTSVDTIKNLKTEVVYSKDIRDEIDEKMSFVYGYQKETETHAKMSVSEIKKISYETENEQEFYADGIRVDLMKAYINEETEPDKDLEAGKEKKAGRIRGAERGTAYHTVFELFDFDMDVTKENIIGMLDKLEQKGRLSREERESICIHDILSFAETDLCERMRAAYKRGELFREAQFVVGFSEAEIERFKQAAKIIGEEKRFVIPEKTAPLGDTVLIQGIIDAYFIEDGKIVLADYKTDRVKQAEDLVNHYFIQLELYKKAVEQIMGIEVSEKILYSVHLNEEVRC